MHSVADSRTRRFAILAIGALVFAFAYLIQNAGDNERAHYALVRALADGTPTIDESLGHPALRTIDVSRFEATFMLDRVPAGEVAVLTLRLDGGSDHRLTVTDGRATTAPAGEAVALEPYRWYRWEVTYQEDVVRLALLRVDGTVLTEDASQAQMSRATEFCMTAAPQTRLYLSDLTLEAQ